MENIKNGQNVYFYTGWGAILEGKVIMTFNRQYYQNRELKTEPCVAIYHERSTGTFKVPIEECFSTYDECASALAKVSVEFGLRSIETEEDLIRFIYNNPESVALDSNRIAIREIARNKLGIEL